MNCWEILLGRWELLGISGNFHTKMDLTTHCNLTRMIWGFLSLGGQRSVDL